jgi:hypothetical protein
MSDEMDGVDEARLPASRGAGPVKTATSALADLLGRVEALERGVAESANVRHCLANNQIYHHMTPEQYAAWVAAHTKESAADPK